MRASRIEDAQDSFPLYDVVPFPASGRITGYFEKHSADLHPLGPHEVISWDTPVLDLPGLLSTRRFYFVNRANRVIGYVHFSDLNKAPSRAPFYALLEAAETSLSARISDRLKEAEIKAVCSPRRFKGIQARLKKQRRSNIDLGWLGALSFGEILRLARRFHTVKLDDEELDLQTNFRNRIAHTNLRLIDTYSDIRRLSKVGNLLQAITKSA